MKSLGEQSVPEYVGSLTELICINLHLMKYLDIYPSFLNHDLVPI